MSLEAMNAVFKCEALTSTQKLVSLYIADKVHQDHFYEFYSTKTNCVRYTSLDKNTVKKVFKELIKNNYIVDTGQRKGKVIVYRFIIEKYIEGYRPNIKPIEESENENQKDRPKIKPTHRPNIKPIDRPKIKPTKQNITQDKTLNSLYSENAAQNKGVVTETTNNQITENKPSKKNQSLPSPIFETDKPSQYQETNLPSRAIKSKNLTLQEIGNQNPMQLPADLLDEWRSWRIKNKLPITPRVWIRINKSLNHCSKAGIDPIEAFEEMVTRGWRDLKVEWIKNLKQDSHYNSNDTSWANDLGDF